MARPREFKAADIRTRANELASILVDCVDGGASIGFVQPFGQKEALQFWSMVAGEVEKGGRVLFAVEHDGRLMGTCQLILSTPANQRHRGEIAKMLVHRRARRLGLGAALLRAAEDRARRIGRTLLILDTVSLSPAETLYRNAGWVAVGSIPNYAAYPDGRLAPTTIFYKELA